MIPDRKKNREKEAFSTRPSTHNAVNEKASIIQQAMFHKWLNDAEKKKENGSKYRKLSKYQRILIARVEYKTFETKRSN
jgi:hypothetical protein